MYKRNLIKYTMGKVYLENKKLFISLVSAFLSLFVFIGCKDSFTYTSNFEYTSPENVATEFFNILCIQDNIVNSRNIEDSAYPEILYETQILGDDDELISFIDLNEEEQKSFYEIWKQDFISDLSQKLSSETYLMEMIDLENKAFIETINSSNRALVRENIDYILKQYKKNLSKLEEKLEKEKSLRSSSSDKLIKIEDGTLIESSVKVFSDNYSKGRILVNTSNSSSASSSYVGHASLMCYNEKYPEWYRNISAKATYTSYPKNDKKGTTWEGQTDGVQYEPIGYWCGTKGAPSVVILDVIYTKWKKLKKQTYTASPEDHNEAVKQAIKYDGKPYNYNLVFFGIWSTDAFYCSSLVFRAWYNVDKKYSLNTNLMYVSPANLVASNNTKKIASYNNK